jgi:hypothetical protein
MSEVPQQGPHSAGPPPQHPPHNQAPHRPEFETSAPANYEGVKKLSTFMVTNIALISVVGLASILLMFFGEFEGKVSRVVSTLLVFAAFTTFTAMDSQARKPGRYMLISQGGNIYMLALSLVYIWGTIGAVNFYDEEIIPGTLGLIVIIKVGTFLLQKVSDYIVSDQQQLSFASFISGIAIAAATILFTLPIGLHHIFNFGEGYWKLGVGTLMLGGLAISVTALLAWFFKEKLEEPVLRKNPKAVSPENPFHKEPDRWDTPSASHTVVSGAGPTERLVASPEVRKSVPAGAPQFAPPVQGPLSWPVFPNGFPLPAKPNGRPDFEALRKMSEMYIEGERQFFG